MSVKNIEGTWCSREGERCKAKGTRIKGTVPLIKGTEDQPTHLDQS